MDATKSGNPLRDFHPSSPFRLPCWRWGWASFVLEARLPVRRIYRGEWFDRTLKYVRALRRLETTDHPRLARLDPAMFAANRLALGDPRTIFEIELRVLANLSPRCIASCCGVSPEAIIAYEQIFYDMRRLLDADGAVLNRIRYSRHLPFTRVDLENMIRTITYWYGHNMIEPTLRYYDERFYPSRVSGKPDPNPQLTQQFARKVESYIWAIDEAHGLEVVKIHHLLMRTEISERRGDSGVLFRPLQEFVDAGPAAQALEAAPGEQPDRDASLVLPTPAEPLTGMVAEYWKSPGVIKFA